MHACFDAVTSSAARVMGLQGYGLEVGCDASVVLLQVSDPIEAIRLRARRLKVFPRGRLLAETPASMGSLHCRVEGHRLTGEREWDCDTA